jgi:hypothetical protein
MAVLRGFLRGRWQSARHEGLRWMFKPPMGGATEEIIRDHIIGLPAGSRGQTFIETIRFAAANNRLLVNRDYRDKQGKRATRSIEAYSLRHSPFWCRPRSSDGPFVRRMGSPAAISLIASLVFRRFRQHFRRAT